MIFVWKPTLFKGKLAKTSQPVFNYRIYRRYSNHSGLRRRLSRSRVRRGLRRFPDLPHTTARAAADLALHGFHYPK